MKSALLLAASCAVLAPSAHAEDDPAVTPYRPTVSSPAALSTPGWVELEGGGLQQRGPGDARRTSLPLTLKLAFTPDLGIVIGGEGWVRQSEAGATQSGGGDTTLVLKQRFALDEQRAFGLELGTKFPTASTAIGSGERDWSANGIYSADLAAGWHTDINVNETRQGAPAGQRAAWQAGWAASLSRALNDDWGAAGELSGTHVAGSAPTVQLLVAGSWNASKAAVLDVGVAKGLNRGTPHAQLFFGGTFRIGRLW
jgi:hypothetical protein